MHEGNKVKNLVKDEHDFKEFIEVLRCSTPHYLGSEELHSINEQMNKIRRKS